MSQSQLTRQRELAALHARYGLDFDAAATPTPLGEWAIVCVAPDERTGAPALSITTSDAPLPQVLTAALVGLGDVLHPAMPVEIVNLARSIRLAPTWRQTSWHQVVPEPIQ